MYVGWLLYFVLRYFPLPWMIMILYHLSCHLECTSYGFYNLILNSKICYSCKPLWKIGRHNFLNDFKIYFHMHFNAHLLSQSSPIQVLLPHIFSVVNDPRHTVDDINGFERILCITWNRCYFHAQEGLPGSRNSASQTGLTSAILHACKLFKFL